MLTGLWLPAKIPCHTNKLWLVSCSFLLSPLAEKLFSNIFCLKGGYRIGKKKPRKKFLRSQIYIKLTRSNDDDSRKHPLKYFCLKCHIWWEINNLTSRLEFIAQWAFYSFLFWHRCNAKFVIGFSLFSRDPDGRSISNFYRFVSLCIWWIT